MRERAKLGQPMQSMEQCRHGYSAQIHGTARLKLTVPLGQCERARLNSPPSNLIPSCSTSGLKNFDPASHVHKARESESKICLQLRSRLPLPGGAERERERGGEIITVSRGKQTTQSTKHGIRHVRAENKTPIPGIHSRVAEYRS